MRRRDGRTAWLPAFLLWVPVLLLGLVLLLAIDVDVDPVGDQHRVFVQVPAPSHWIDEPVRFAVGLASVAAGLALFGLAGWRPAARRVPGVVNVYPLFLTGALLLAGALLFASLSRQGDAFDFARGAVQWRFLVDLRGGMANRLTQAALAVAILVCLAASFGRASRQAVRSGQPRLTGAPVAPPVEPPEDAPITA